MLRLIVILVHPLKTHVSGTRLVTLDCWLEIFCTGILPCPNRSSIFDPWFCEFNGISSWLLLARSIVCVSAPDMKALDSLLFATCPSATLVDFQPKCRFKSVAFAPASASHVAAELLKLWLVYRLGSSKSSLVAIFWANSEKNSLHKLASSACLRVDELGEKRAIFHQHHPEHTPNILSTTWPDNASDWWGEVDTQWPFPQFSFPCREEFGLQASPSRRRQHEKISSVSLRISSNRHEWKKGKSVASEDFPQHIPSQLVPCSGSLAAGHLSIFVKK